MRPLSRLTFGCAAATDAIRFNTTSDAATRDVMRMCAPASPGISALPAAANHDAGTRARVALVVEHDASVHDHRRDADRILKRIRERRAVGDRRRIEDHEIGREARFDKTAIL